MADMVEYIVARAHQGDRHTDEGSEVHMFQEGETRLADPTIVATLVKSGVLVDPAAEKAEPPLENKSAGNAPANKKAAAPRAPRTGGKGK
jgi:hypothetical protein